MQDKEPASEGLGALQAAVTELRDGQDELLRMYEELRELYPQNCRCAAQAERARAAALAADPLAWEFAREDYVPGDGF